MRSAEKLVRDICATLDSAGFRQTASALAADFAQLGREANARLEQCAAMIAHGSDYQALQLAETEPALLDLVAALSFGRLREWTAFCEANQLAMPERLDPAWVKTVNTLYERGVTPNHPLYKEYRAAITSRDDGHALHIIRSIVRLNPADANARAELARIEHKLFLRKSGELGRAVEEGVEAHILRVLGELEQVATPEQLAQTPGAAEALELRRQAARCEAMVQAGELVATLPESRNTGEWQHAGETLARIEALEAEYGFAREPGDAALCREVQSWSEGRRAAAIEAAHVREALASLSAQVEEIEARRESGERRRAAEVSEDYLGLEKQWKEFDGQPVPGDVEARVTWLLADLREERRRIQRRRRWLIGAATGLAVVALGAGGWLGWRRAQGHAYAAQLEQVMATGQVEATTKFVLAVPGAITGDPRLRARMAQAQSWAAAERRKRVATETLLLSLYERDTAALAAELPAARAQVEALAAELAAEPRAQLLALESKAAGGIQRAVNEVLGEIEPALVEKITFDKLPEEAAAALREIEPKLERLKGLEALGPAEAVKARVEAVQAQVASVRQELARIEQTRAALKAATTLEAYRKALEGCRESLFTHAPELRDARRLLARFPSVDEVLGALLLPGDPACWNAVQADAATGATFVPADVQPAELSKLLSLRDDDNLRDVWEVTLVDYEAKGATRTIYGRGDVKRGTDSIVNERTRRTWSGQFFEPQPASVRPQFVAAMIELHQFADGTKRYREVSSARRSTPSTALAALGLSHIIDDAGTKFQRPMLKVLDDLVRQKDAHPVFKAFAMQQLAELVQVRPQAWGWHYALAARRDLARLEQTLRGLRLGSGDWMLPAMQRELGPRLEPFFAGLAGRTYWAQARVLADLMQAVRASGGLAFGGYVAPGGTPQLLVEASDAPELWAAGPDGVGPFAREATGARPPAFSPIFHLNLDRQKTLDEICRRHGIANVPSGEDAPPILAPATPALK